MAARKKLRRQMRAFPAAPCSVALDSQLWTLAPSAECPIAEENLAKGLLDLGHGGKVGISCTRSAVLARMMWLGWGCSRAVAAALEVVLPGSLG